MSHMFEFIKLLQSKVKKILLLFFLVTINKSAYDKYKKSINLSKNKHNPIITPNPDNEWESWQTFNPGVVKIQNTIYFIYRALGPDGISRFGYATSNDGFTLKKRLTYPIYNHSCVTNPYHYTQIFASGGGWAGTEDPRLVKMKHENTIYMTYISCDDGLRMALTSISVADFVNKRWKWSMPKLISPPNQLHKNWVMFPEKINGKYAILHRIEPDISIAYLDKLDFNDNFIESSFTSGNRKSCWDNWMRGAGPPPIKTKYGWLLLYHAMDIKDPNKYKVGAMLLDKHDPTRIIARSKEPILEPTDNYEYEGFKAGVVYASGAVIKNNQLLVYYGGADSYVCVAYTDINKFMYNLNKHHSIPFSTRLLKKLKNVS